VPEITLRYCITDEKCFITSCNISSTFLFYITDGHVLTDRTDKYMFSMQLDSSKLVLILK